MTAPAIETNRPERRPLRVGIQLPEVEREVRWPELLDMVRLVDDAGFDSIWVGDHLLYRFEDGAAAGPWECWSLMSAIAASTTRVEIGPLVAATSFHSPAMLAKMATTIDEISGGRLILGLGAGWNETDYRAFGFAYDNRISRFEEAFTIIRTLLREGTVDFVGRHYEIRDCEILPRGPRPGGPPLLIGSSGERMLSITMPHADAWNIWYADFGNAPEGLAPFRARVDAACLSAGRDPAEVERTAAVLVQVGGGRGRRQGDVRAEPPVRGTPEEIAAALRRFAAEGIGHVQVVLDPITTASIEELVPVLEALDRA
jgi:alkanesulfonate monooxygenase SsuD/methylene tetrahydromethanopterin reductase-like flavin-dependent oxidoreductase (luciferase family)